MFRVCTNKCKVFEEAKKKRRRPRYKVSTVWAGYEHEKNGPKASDLLLNGGNCINVDAKGGI